MRVAKEFTVYLRSLSRIVAMLAVVAALAACEDSEERAERYYQSGLSLLEEGDVERALVEFRNVFNLDGSHRGARQTYARIMREQGRIRDSYSQYLRLVEQYPDDLEGRVALAEMAFTNQDWEEFERHADAAVEAAPEDPAVRTIEAASDYRQAIVDEDEAARRSASAQIAALRKEWPENRILQQLEIDGYVRDMAYSKALAEIDAALKKTPDDRGLYNTRLGVLARLQDNEALERQMRDMVTRFSEDETIKQALIRFYMSRDEPEKAEAFLREIADPNAEDPALYNALLGLIGELHGSEAMMKELDRVIPEVTNPATYRAMRAGLVFQQGDQAAGIAAMEEILAAAEPSVATRRIKVSLAQMLLQTGNEVGARRMIEEILAEDPSQIEALRMTAAWQIKADDTDGAIATLRNALDQAPQDVAAMTLMSQAYLRAGNRDLARDFLSLAVDSSGHAPAESVRYARFLSEEGRYIPAEQALVAGLRTSRDDPALLAELGRVYLLMEDLPRLRQVIASLEKQEGQPATQAAASLQAALIERESGADAAIAFLEDISQDWEDSLAATGAIVRARLANGDSAAALKSAEAALAEDPESPERRYLMAATQAGIGDLKAAEAGYRSLLEDHPDRPRVWLELIRILGAQGQNDEVSELVEEGLTANPGHPDLLWVKASNLEQAGNIDGSIAIYEELYEQNSESVIVANNLASLLASHRDDAESLERAATVARRLRDMPQPAFQDTWGWIVFRQGDVEGALAPLESAAEGLPRDAVVQYHLGRVYEALSRLEDAQLQFEKAVDLGSVDNTTVPLADARARLEALRTAAPERKETEE
jgi:cellulose synthase operon protein C